MGTTEDHGNSNGNRQFVGKDDSGKVNAFMRKGKPYVPKAGFGAGRKKLKAFEVPKRYELTTKKQLMYDFIMRAWVDMYDLLGAGYSQVLIDPEILAYLNANKLIGTDRLLDETGLNPDVEAIIDDAQSYRSQRVDADIKYTEDDAKIVKQDWMPYSGDDPYDMEPDFVVWVKSIMYGFSRAHRYQKFETYVKQARAWDMTVPRFEDFVDYTSKIAFVREEVRRFNENSLYFVLRYGIRADEESETGLADFKNPYVVQMAICYLFDLGYSLLIPKIRQLGFSTLIGHLLYVKTAYRYNFRTKFIASDITKTSEIFTDKVNFVHSNMPFYIKPMTYNDSAFTLTFVDDKTAGERQKGKRAIIVSAPNDDAINGGSPAIYAIDEAGDIKNLRTMIAEAEPAMFKDDHKSGKRIRKRQGIIWGTGGEMETDAFESMVWSTVKAWEKGEHMWSFIVVFADYYSRPYNTEELYNTLRRRAYNEEGEDAETLRRQFHAHYAITLEDVFLRSTNTLIPIPYINKAIKRIDNLKVSNPEMSYVRGKFVPIESDEPWEGGAIVGLPKKVVGVEFRAEIQSVESNEDGSSTLYTPPVAMIPVAPDLSWANRYFQGTDPINSSSGHSKFASCIWDAVLDAPFCILDYRVEDIRMVYQQCILMNIYYGRCFHLVEYNIGQTLIEALQTMEMGSQLILNSALPPYLRIQGSKIGISNKPGVRDRIIDEMKTLFMDFRDKMWFEQPFIQLKNFTNEGKRWETENNKIHHDDVLFAMTFSKIACNAFRRMGYTPMSPEQVKTVITDTKKLVRGSDGSLHYQNGTGNVVQDQFSNSIINI